jgi:hypothetical protein
MARGMGQERVNVALARIESALARLEAAAADGSAAPRDCESATLRQAHQALRSRVEGAIAQLDELLAAQGSR